MAAEGRLTVRLDVGLDDVSEAFAELVGLVPYLDERDRNSLATVLARDLRMLYVCEQTETKPGAGAGELAVVSVTFRRSDYLARILEHAREATGHGALG